MHQDKSRTYQLTILLSLSYKLVFDSNKVLLGVHQNWLIHHQYSKHKLNIKKKRIAEDKIMQHVYSWSNSASKIGQSKSTPSLHQGLFCLLNSSKNKLDTYFYPERCRSNPLFL